MPAHDVMTIMFCHIKPLDGLIDEILRRSDIRIPL